jgi:DNA-directed RNA polymerase subunit RPC12/RpoP
MQTATEFVKCLCRCGQKIEYDLSDAGAVIDCPGCGSRLQLPAQSDERRASRIQQGRGFGWWSAVKLVCALLFLLPGFCGVLFFGSMFVTGGYPGSTLAFAMMLGLGSLVWFMIGGFLYHWAERARTQWVCSDCGNPVARYSRLCPTCHAHLQ